MSLNRWSNFQWLGSPIGDFNLSSFDHQSVIEFSVIWITNRCLNSYFSSVFTVERPNSVQLSKPLHCIMPAIEVTQPGVLKLLTSLNPKKSTGPDQLSPWILKETSCEITPILTYIFNQLLATGTVPKDWRLANIFPLHKKGPRDLAENYRPISLTSVCSKILEHIVYSGISKQ